MATQPAAKLSAFGLPIDKAKLDAFLGQMVNETGAAMNAALILVGEKLGLYRAMAGAGPLTPTQLAEKTGTDGRYVRALRTGMAGSSGGRRLRGL